MGKLISLSDYAKLHNKEASYIRRRAVAGQFKTAQKIGRNWIISEDEPLFDLRFKNPEQLDGKKRD